MNQWLTPAIAYLALSLSASSAWSQTSLSQAWTLDGFDQPESVVADEQGEWLYISNINGAPTEANGQGYISRVDRHGQQLTHQWVAGLDAPKGLAIHAGKLYVADLHTLVVIELASGRVLERHTDPKAQLLNDVAVSDTGVVYVSDWVGGGVYRLFEGEFSKWISQAQIPLPNGLLWHQGSLWLASWGEQMKNDFSTQVAGQLYRIDTESKHLHLIPESYQLGNLDGLVSDGQHFYISDWMNGALYQVAEQRRLKVLQTQQGLADIGLYHDTLFAPMMMDGQIVAWQLTQ